MSPNHDHGHDCGDHAHDHDHTHDTSGPSDNVFIHIDRDNVVALNSTSDGKQVIKPWNERSDEQGEYTAYIESDADDQLSRKEPLQQFDVAVGREVGEYTLKAAKFPNVSTITLFFPASQGAETTRIYYVGFLGQWSERKQDPVIAVYESQANPADHKKIQGTEGNFSMPSL
ncbi:hypothetical protein BC826DRAFT_1014274 [Russula brevipes]|nr:hypothetical protein BC826DRAFT_1014274 [Russula brevipes]